MSTITPTEQVAPGRNEWARRFGFFMLLAWSGVVGMVGLRVHSGLLLLPLAAVLSGACLPRGSWLRMTLFVLATTGLVVLAALVAFVLFLLFSNGVQFG